MDVDKFIISKSGGFDIGVSSTAVMNTFEALEVASILIKEECKNVAKLPIGKRKIDLNGLSKTMNNLARMVDDIVRLSQFVEGHTKDRNTGGKSLLEELTNEQIAKVTQWIKENKAKQVEEIK